MNSNHLLLLKLLCGSYSFRKFRNQILQDKKQELLKRTVDDLRRTDIRVYEHEIETVWKNCLNIGSKINFTLSNTKYT